jgi:hypothetical protein
VVLVIAAVLGAAGSDVAYGGWPRNLASQVLLLLTFAAAAWLIVFTAVRPQWTWTDVTSWLKKHQKPVLGAAVVLLLVAAYNASAAGFGNGSEPEPDDCPYPNEVRVLTSPDSLEMFQQVADAYVQWDANEHDGCQQVSVHVFAAPFEGTRGAKDTLLAGWPEDVLRQWPKPDVWLADSSSDVDGVAAGPDDLVAIADREKIARAPLVLAVPVGQRGTLGAEPRWADVYEDVITSGDWRVSRPNPRLSASGVAATTVLHSDRVPAARDDGSAGQLERNIDSPLGESDLLCSLFPEPDPADEPGPVTSQPAAIVTEQALIAYNQGALSCGRPADADRLAAVYPDDTVHLFREFVRFDWPDTADPQDAAAGEFGEWLVGLEGKLALQEVGMRPVGLPVDDPISEKWGANPLGSIGTQLAAEEADVAIDRYLEVRDPGLLMLLLDTSGSMATEVNASGNRLQLAHEAVVGALQLMIEEDEFTLRVFPAEDAQDGDPVSETLLSVDGGSDFGERRLQADQALAAVLERVGGETRLFDAIDESARALTREADADQARALVVITDGHDTGSDIGVEELAKRVAAEDVRLFAVAVGEATCRTGLERVADGSGGQCYPTTFDDLELTLSEIASGLWGGGSRERQ